MNHKDSWPFNAPVTVEEVLFFLLLMHILRIVRIHFLFLCRCLIISKSSQNRWILVLLRENYKMENTLLIPNLLTTYYLFLIIVIGTITMKILSQSESDLYLKYTLFF